MDQLERRDNQEGACDLVGSPRAHGKASAWNAYQRYPHVYQPRYIQIKKLPLAKQSENSYHVREGV
ncbi:hypothetical protein SporoP32a_13900 [Sporosarcina ureae]|nr:hypothetical protein SporoP32a_13900 [Sporosarcina ureae]